MSSKPNILLITTDTQRWDTLRCMGNTYALSPNIDRLAQDGVIFTQGHTSSPVCMPARCSLLTGLHTPIHGCIENGIRRRDDVPVLTDFLKEKGYVNIMVGKTHFGRIPDSFDIQHVIKGEKGQDMNDFYADHIRNHDYSRVSSHPNTIPEDLFMDAFLVSTAIQDIENVIKHKKNPFFMFCSLPSPHSPIDPPGRWANVYDGIPLPAINYKPGELENLPLHLKRLIGTLNACNGNEEVNSSSELYSLGEGRGITIEGKDMERINHYRRLYYGLAAYCDAQIGRLIDYIDKSGLREDTLIIFSSDHGQQLFDHGFNDKHNYYDSSWRVPFILSMPGTLPMGEERDFAIWNDITATILAVAGIECADVQGFDLFTPIKDGKESPRKCAVATLYKSAALATKGWKLEYYFEEAVGRLFNRVDDPYEQMDLYNVTGYSDVRDELIRALLTWRSDICDVGFLIRNTDNGGPVARRIAKHTRAMRGVDAEQRLNEIVESIDSELQY